MSSFKVKLMNALRWVFTLVAVCAILYFGASVMADKADSCAAECRAMGKSVEFVSGKTSIDCRCVDVAIQAR
jgi:hypothetical protein